MNIKVLQSLEPWKRLYFGLTLKQRILAAGSAVVTIVLVWFAVRSANTPAMSVLGSQTDPAVASKLVEKLAEKGIKAETDAQGRVMVPAEKLDEARLATADDAKGGNRLGFELFDKTNFSSSDFDERVNYQRALESELEQTIRTIAEVENARVHLVMPEYSLYEQRDRPAKASVTVALRAGTLEKKTVRAIQNLVSSAVPGLDANSVSVIGTDGVLYTTGTAALAEEEETRLQGKLVSTLEGIVGAGRVRASVVIERQMAEVASTEETYDKLSAVPLSVQRSEQRVEIPILQGVAGSSANVPASAHTALSSRTDQGQNSTSESSTYGVNRSTRRSVEPAGQVRRISAAVVIDDGGKPRSDQEVASLKDLASACAGIDTRRGDVLQFRSISFPRPDLLPQSEAKYYGLWRALLRSSSLIRALLLCLTIVTITAVVVRPVVMSLSAAIQKVEQTMELTSAAQAGSSLSAAEYSLESLKSGSLSKVLEKPEGARRVISKWLQKHA